MGFFGGNVPASVDECGQKNQENGGEGHAGCVAGGRDCYRGLTPGELYNGVSAQYAPQSRHGSTQNGVKAKCRWEFCRFGNMVFLHFDLPLATV